MTCKEYCFKNMLWCYKVTAALFREHFVGNGYLFVDDENAVDDKDMEAADEEGESKEANGEDGARTSPSWRSCEK